MVREGRKCRDMNAQKVVCEAYSRKWTEERLICTRGIMEIVANGSVGGGVGVSGEGMSEAVISVLVA